MERISAKLIDLIENNANQLTQNWLKDVQHHPATPTYHTYDQRKLFDRAFDVYSRLGKWISEETTEDMIAEHYAALGNQRRREGFALSEVIQALILTRRHLWLKVLSEGLIDSAMELYQALELYNRIIRFFDQATLFAAQGYERKE